MGSEKTTTYYRTGLFATSNRKRAIEIFNAYEGLKRIDWVTHTGDFYDKKNHKKIAEGIIVPENGWRKCKKFTYYDKRTGWQHPNDIAMFGEEKPVGW